MKTDKMGTSGTWRRGMRLLAAGIGFVVASASHGACVATVQQGEGHIDCDSENDTVLLDEVGGLWRVNGSVGFSGQTLVAAGVLHVSLGAGSDTLTIGSDTAPAATLPGLVLIESSGADTSDQLVIDDMSDAAATDVVIDENGFIGTWQFGASALVKNSTIFLGGERLLSAADSVVYAYSTYSATPLSISADQRALTVIVGEAGSMQQIAAPIHIDGTGPTIIALDDHDDAVDQQVMLTGNGMFGSLSAEVTWNPATPIEVDLWLGTGSDEADIFDVPATVFFDVDGGDGDDVIAVNGPLTLGSIALRGGPGSDRFDVLALPSGNSALVDGGTSPGDKDIIEYAAGRATDDGPPMGDIVPADPSIRVLHYENIEAPDRLFADGYDNEQI
jgi:hypothetical protein